MKRGGEKGVMIAQKRRLQKIVPNEKQIQLKKKITLSIKLSKIQFNFSLECVTLESKQVTIYFFGYSIPVINAFFSNGI